MAVGLSVVDLNDILNDIRHAHFSHDLARLINFDHDELINLAFKVPDSEKYETIYLPKRDSSIRIIRSPNRRLKSVQTRLLTILEGLYRPHSRAHGYVKGKGLRTHASLHVGKKIIFNCDLKDFFPSINLGRIRGRLMAAPYGLSNSVATTIAKLCTCDEVLPMGAPTSPILSNMICSNLDSELASLAKNYGCFYSRYADDLTFSTNRSSFPRAIGFRDRGDDQLFSNAGIELISIIISNGFSPNHKKSRLVTQHDRQEVCGVVCNEKMNALPKLRRQIRACLHAWRKFGYEKAKEEWLEKYNYRGAKSFGQHVKGKIAFLAHIRGPNDKTVAKYVSQFNDLVLEDYAIKYEFVEDIQSSLSNHSVLIEGYGEGEEISQGSGFVIEGGYIITNHHVVFKNGIELRDIEVSQPDLMQITLKAIVIESDPKVDLAILKICENEWHEHFKGKAIKIAEKEPIPGDLVWLSGWPDHHDGDDLFRTQTSIVGSIRREGTRYFRVSTPIIYGNSGGAVVDENSHAVGVVTIGSDVEGAPHNVQNAFLPISLAQTLMNRLPK